MNEDGAPRDTNVVITRDQPFLYSWNRRLRHLHGISLRNLNISSTGGRSRGKTVTEDDQDLRTHVILLAQHDRTSLHHSQSFDNLAHVDRTPKTYKLSPGPSTPSTHDAAHRRPTLGKMRRRSTMHWGSASPRERQQKLEEVERHRLVDTWFSIHHTEVEDPIYISEVMERCMNPSFSFFDLDKIPASIARSDELTVKIWSKTSQAEQYILLVDLTANLCSLEFVGKSLDNFHHPLPPNCVLFHLEDGIYTSFTDLPADEICKLPLRPAQKNMAPVNMASYDALLKLANLDECIQDALQTRAKLEADINSLLAKTRSDRVVPEQLTLQQQKVDDARQALGKEREQVAKLQARSLELQKSRDQRQKAMAQAISIRKAAADVPEKRQATIGGLKADSVKLSEQADGQIRRVCEDLLHIFPIEPIKNRTLQFTIRHIYLPNSVFDDTNRDEIAAALGYTGQLVHHLSLYLSIPLPYPIEVNGSSSFIHDPISLSLAQRQFPLHPTNVSYKFEYGVFLLNKDIEFLMNRSQLRVLDIRQTLPNLKYLLYVLTAGTGELPMRKAGGVRGLWGGMLTPSLSRRGSEDSVHSKTSLDVMQGNLGVAAKVKNGYFAESIPGRVKGLPYRNSLLREV